MFDTVAISRTFARPPNVDLLVENGCKPFYSKYSGEVDKLVLNGEVGAKEPRLTISPSPNGLWILRAEVSIGAWLHGSNLFLPDENDLNRFFPDLSQFVELKTGIPFDAHNERTTRLDVTRDFILTESRVMGVLNELKNLVIPKYHCKPIDNKTVVFENKGRDKNKRIIIYSKYHDLIDKKASETEIERARGILRLEIEHKNNRAVSNLSGSLKIPYQYANRMITRETSEAVIEKAMKLLSLDSILNNQSKSKLETLALEYPSSMPLTLAGHLLFKQQFGAEYYKLPFINLKAETVKEYERKCAKTGTLSLE